MELSRIIIFFLCLIKCFVFLIIILVIWMWWVGDLLNVDVMILLWIVCFIFVIFLGRLLMRRMIRKYFGLLCMIDWVMFCNNMVLFVFGGVMIIECWFLLIGVIKLIICVVKFFVVLLLSFIINCLVGKSGVKFLNKILLCEFFGVL